MENTEIEIKVKVGNSKLLFSFLEKEGAFKYETHHIDEYFSPSHRDFLAVRPANEWLRLRNADGVYSITYKNYHPGSDGISHHCDEYESPLGDIEDMEKIFEVLNFKSIVTVDKIRKSWDYKDYEVSIDTVKGLGEFVEIEYKGKETVEPEKVTAEMIEFLEKVGCGKIERDNVGYPFLLLFGEKN